MKRYVLFTTAIALALLVSVSAQQDLSKVEITVTPVAGPVYMLQGAGGNIGVVVSDDGVIMIDAQYAALTDKIRTALKDLPGHGSVRILVNTHWHSDHTNGNKAFGPTAAIVAHENVRKLLAANQTIMGRSVEPLPTGALPDVTFTDRLTLYAGNEPVQLVHYADAHTDGDTVVFIPGVKVAHLGDMFFAGIFPFMDVDHGGDIESWARQLEKIIAQLPPDVKVIPGHGPLSSLDDLKAFRQMLLDAADIVRKQMAASKTLDQIKAAGLPERFAQWSKGFMSTERWIELVYRSLEKHKKL